MYLLLHRLCPFKRIKAMRVNLVAIRELVRKRGALVVRGEWSFVCGSCWVRSRSVTWLIDPFAVIECCTALAYKDTPTRRCLSICSGNLSKYKFAYATVFIITYMYVYIKARRAVDKNTQIHLRSFFRYYC